jgi:hypothetical protein
MDYYLGWTVALDPYRKRNTNDIDTIFERECGVDGDCMFYALGAAVCKSMQFMRDTTASAIHVGNVGLFLYLAKEEEENKDGGWKPEWYSPSAILAEPDIDTQVALLRETISTAGTWFQGDHLALSMIAKSKYFLDQKLGVLAIMSDGVFNGRLFEHVTETSYIDVNTEKKVVTTTHHTEKFIIIYNVEQYHWRLGGVSDGKGGVAFTFMRNNIPPIIQWIDTRIMDNALFKNGSVGPNR